MLKLLEGKLHCNEAKDEYNLCKENLNVIFDKIESRIKTEGYTIGMNLARNLANS